MWFEKPRVYPIPPHKEIIVDFETHKKTFPAHDFKVKDGCLLIITYKDGGVSSLAHSRGPKEVVTMAFGAGAWCGVCMGNEYKAEREG